MSSFSLRRRALRLVVGVGCGLFVLFGWAGVGNAAPRKARRTSGEWVATWTAAQHAPTNDLFTLIGEPTNPGVRGFNNQTVRNIAFTSSGGRVLRVHLSNAYGTQPVVIGRTTIAVELSGAQLVPGTLRNVSFNGNSSVTIPAGGDVVSDPVDLAVRPLEDLAVSLFLPTATGPTTYHFFSQQTNYVAPGDLTAVEAPDSYAALPSTTSAGSSWYYLSGIDVRSSRSSRGAVVAFGDSITDGFESQVNANDRWPNLLDKRLIHAVGERAPSVVDEGIGGNRVLTDSSCFGVSALHRFDRDALSVPGVKDVILLEGINDIEHSYNTGPCFTEPQVTAADIEQGDKRLIAEAHANGLKIFGATLTPVNFPASDPREQVREQLNNWIRTSGAFDGVFDFDKAVRDRRNPLYFNPSDDSGDHLHPNDAGYQAMANVIRLSDLLH
jgi:lysophospholipase L1-like esterase